MFFFRKKSSSNNTPKSWSNYTALDARSEIRQLEKKINDLNDFVEKTYLRKDNVSRTIPVLGVLTAVLNKGYQFTQKDRNALKSALKKEQSGGKNKPRSYTKKRKLKSKSK
jgi:hypothetical protein